MECKNQADMIVMYDEKIPMGFEGVDRQRNRRFVLRGEGWLESVCAS
jgi:hypothetical protein